MLRYPITQARERGTCEQQVERWHAVTLDVADVVYNNPRRWPCLGLGELASVAILFEPHDGSAKLLPGDNSGTEPAERVEYEVAWLREAFDYKGRELQREAEVRWPREVDRVEAAIDVEPRLHVHCLPKHHSGMVFEIPPVPPYLPIEWRPHPPR